MAGETDRMVELARAHALAEGRGDLAATLATLEDGATYELQPVGRRFTGLDAARRAYEHFFSAFMPMAEGHELRQEWVTSEGLGQEYSMTIRLPDGRRETHAIIGIITFGSQRLSGERVYASESLFRMMYGPAYEESEPISR